MNEDVALALMSVTMVLPAMVVLLYLVFSGKLGSTENARWLPLREREDDVWQQEPPDATHEKGG